jgi:hypothetical protein
VKEGSDAPQKAIAATDTGKTVKDAFFIDDVEPSRRSPLEEVRTLKSQGGKARLRRRHRVLGNVQTEVMEAHSGKRLGVSSDSAAYLEEVRAASVAAE